MINETYKTFFEENLDETVKESRLLMETGPSRIYLVAGKRQYILKETKRIALNNQFATHKKVFRAWYDRRDTLAFKIPEPFLLGPEGKFIFMEYIDGDNLLKGLVSGKDNIEDIRRATGAGVINCPNVDRLSWSRCLATSVRYSSRRPSISMFSTV